MLTYVDFTRADRRDIAWRQILTALGAPSESEPPKVPEEQEPVPSAASTGTLLDLRKKLGARCSIGDLKDLCFVMDIDHDNYPSAKSDFIRELLLYLNRRGRLDEFTEVVRAEKPWVLR